MSTVAEVGYAVTRMLGSHRAGSRIFMLAGSFLAAGATPSFAQQPKAVFARDIQPILERSCYACHGPKQQMGALRLDSRKVALEGGISHGVIKPGDADASPLYRRVAGLGDQPRMPMGGQLPPEEI